MNSMIKLTTLREIKETFGRFFAIFAIISLGVGFFSGVRSTTPAMALTFDGFLREHQLFDYRLISKLGWTDDDLEAFRAMPDVRYAEGSYSYDVIYTTTDHQELVLKTHALLEHINGIELTEGRLPEALNECVLDARIKELPELGSKIYVAENNYDDTKLVLSYTELTVVGYANASYYINFERGTTSIGNGSVAGFVYVLPDSFDSDIYTEVFVKFDEDYKIYSKDYKHYISSKEKAWEDAIRLQADKRYDVLFDDALAEIKSMAEDSAFASIPQLSRAEELMDTWGMGSISDILGMSEIVTMYRYAEDLGVVTREDVVALFSSYGMQDLGELFEQIIDYYPEVYLLGRGTNVGYACFEGDSEIVAQVARVFPIFFIAALVCMTTMSRMVEEQRTQIGVLKALGYSEAAIMGKYMFYSGSAALLGCVFGYLVGTNLFPRVIWFTYQLMYIHMPMRYAFDLKLMITAILVALICSIGTTWISCHIELEESAAELMRPKAPKIGKRVLLERIPWLWRRLKFLYKVSIRNIFRYKRRLFMMVLGISGCTALLITGFGLNDSVADFAEMQYEEIQIADASLVYNDGVGDVIPDSLAEKLDEHTETYLLIHEASWDLSVKNTMKNINLIVPHSFDQIGLYMDFHTEAGEAVACPGLGEAIIGNSLSKRYNIKVGDTITLYDDSMRELNVRVSGIFENHVYNYIFMSSDTLEAQLGEPVNYNAAYLNISSDADIYQVSAALMSDPNVTNVTVFAELKNRLSSMMNSLNYVVLLVILSAAGLAFIVIYNLTNINITERIREIATIKVLGFFRNETSAYVLRENLVLTSLGIAVGLFLGVLLHRFVMAQIVVDLVSFRVHIKPISFLYSIVLSFAFNFLVNIAMNKKLDKINMAESLKSIE